MMAWEQMFSKDVGNPGCLEYRGPDPSNSVFQKPLLWADTELIVRVCSNLRLNRLLSPRKSLK